MYVILKNKKYSDFNFTLDAPKNLPREVNFTSGALISDSISLNTPLVFETDATKGCIMPDFSRSTVTLMSKRFVKLMEEAGVDNLQKFDAEIKSNVDGTVWRDFFAVNVLGMISCADLQKSTYDEIMPGHYIFDKLAIDAEKAKGALLFRLKEHAPSIIMDVNVGKYIASKDPDRTLTGWAAGKVIQ